MWDPRVVVEEDTGFSVHKGTKISGDTVENRWLSLLHNCAFVYF